MTRRKKHNSEPEETKPMDDDKKPDTTPEQNIEPLLAPMPRPSNPAVPKKMRPDEKIVTAKEFFEKNPVNSGTKRYMRRFHSGAKKTENQWRAILSGLATKKVS